MTMTNPIPVGSRWRHRLSQRDVTVITLQADFIFYKYDKSKTGNPCITAKLHENAFLSRFLPLFLPSSVKEPSSDGDTHELSALEQVLSKLNRLEGQIAALPAAAASETWVDHYAPKVKQLDVATVMADLFRTVHGGYPLEEAVDNWINAAQDIELLDVLEAIGDVDLSEPIPDLRQGWSRVRRQLAYNALVSAVSHALNKAKWAAELEEKS